MGAVITLALGSCAYDPNYVAGGAYSTGYGYGEGYGYGGNGFSTSLFISTGDPRWGYDPYCYCYYDYYRHSYYDPYLYGYYPSGYRPLLVVGVPHPYGYSRSFCPPPSRVTSVTLSNYRNRESAYRSTNYAWAHQVRQQAPYPRGQAQSQQRPAPGSHGPTANYPSTHTSSQPSGGYSQPRGASTSGNPATRHPAGQPANYNAPGRATSPGGADPRRGHAAPASQGGPQVRGGGAVPQRQAPAAATKGRGDKEAGGRSER